MSACIYRSKKYSYKVHTGVWQYHQEWMEEPVGYSPQGHKESDTIEPLNIH